MEEDELPPGWVVWSREEGGRLVLAYRPDVFDGKEYPAECLPTIFLTRSAGNDPRVRGRSQDPDRPWLVECRLEPAVPIKERRVGSRAAAVDVARRTAEEFSRGQLDFRAAYQEPRPAYFAALERCLDCPDC